MWAPRFHMAPGPAPQRHPPSSSPTPRFRALVVQPKGPQHYLRALHTGGPGKPKLFGVVLSTAVESPKRKGFH